MLVDNSLSGPIGSAPSNTQLDRTAREGTVSVVAPERAGYSSARLVHGLTTLETHTGHHRANSTPRLEVSLPAAPWHLRFYAYLPAMQAAGHGTDEVRWIARLGTHGLIVHETSAGNIGLAVQPDGLAQAALAPALSGAAVAIGQWVRVEVTSDGTDTVARVYPGHATTGERVATWTGTGLPGGVTAEVSAYRYRAGVLLQPGANDAADGGTLVEDRQNQILVWDPNALPMWGADGDYGQETTDAVLAFQQEYGIFPQDGEIGPETGAALDLVVQEIQGDPTPPPTYLSHLAEDTTSIGPAAVPGTGATLSATATVGSSSSKHATTTATVSGQGVVSSTASKHAATTATLGAVGSITAEVSAQHIPTFPPLLTTELMINGEWVDITSDVRTSDDLVIRRGRADEASRADPSSLSLVLNNRHGHYSPRNPLGKHYGRIGRNTPVRVRAGALPDPGVTLLRDSFDREVTGGWGNADTGSAWTQISGTPEQAWVSGGTGNLRLDEIDYFVSIVNGVIVADFDATWEVSTDTLPQGELPGALYMAMDARTTETGGYHAVRMNARIATDSGSPDGRCRVGADIGLYVAGVYHQITPVDAVAQEVTYAPGEWLTVRCVAEGAQVRMKVWPSGSPEPATWIAQGHVGESSITDGAIVIRPHITRNADGTPLPTTVSYRNLRIARPTAPAPAVRFAGEISSWPPRWDLSDSDVWVPIAASGIMRRLGQGQKPLRSVLRRTLPAFRPLAYWPMEDGSLASQAMEVMGAAGPLTTSGLAYGEVDSLISSAPLPKVRPGARIMSGPIPAQDSGAWEINLLYRLDEVSQSSDDQMLFDVYTSTMRVYITTAVWTDGRPIMVLHTEDLDGEPIAEAKLLYVDQTDAPVPVGQWNRMRIRSATAESGTFTELGVLDFTGAFRGTWHYYTYDPGVGSPAKIDTRVGSDVGDLSFGHITVWGSHLATAYFASPSGFTGESTTDRLSRLSVGDQVPVLVGGDAATELGPEPPGTWLEAVGSAMDADLGTPGESREELGLTYRARSALYNREPALTLDYASGHISDPVEPVDDDQNVRNDVETKRDYGSSFHVMDETGPLGVNTVGRYDESVTLSLASDDQLADQAGWRLHLGTVDELRWPTIRVNLANSRMRSMIPTILGLDAGDRIRILNPPHWTQASDLDLIVQGYEERIGAFVWELTLTCTPASAWTVAHVADGAEVDPDPAAPERADSDGSVLEFAVTAEETSLAVSATGQTWTVDPADMPFDIFVGGEVMRVTSVIGDGSTGFPQSFIVTRSINTIVKDHVAGTQVRLAQPAAVAL